MEDHQMPEIIINADNQTLANIVLARLHVAGIEASSTCVSAQFVEGCASIGDQAYFETNNGTSTGTALASFPSPE